MWRTAICEGTNFFGKQKKAAAIEGHEERMHTKG